MSAPAGWEDILDEDEEILWQGRPGAGIVLRGRDVAGLLFGLAFAGFALFWMLVASRAGGSFWTFGLIHFAVGLGLAFGGIFWSAWRRRHTWYTLTDKRAFIATDLPMMGRSLKSYPITAETVLDYDGGAPATIHFAHETRRGKNRDYRVEIGFERIEGGAEVYRMMREIQERQAG